MTLRPSPAARKTLLERAAKAYAEQMEDSQIGLEYLAARGLLDSRNVHHFGVVGEPVQGHERYEGRLAIPFIGPAGNVYDIRYRCIQDHDHRESKCAKYLNDPGVETRVYNTRALLAPTDYIFITEGEIDAATLAACGWPAVGLPGASSWKGGHRPRLFHGFQDIIVIGDGDDAGRQFVDTVVKSLASARGVMICEGEDVNSTYVKGGKDALRELLKEDE